jgi:cysteine desulfurase
MINSIYLDWAATAPINPQILDIIKNGLLNYPGNPSSIHAEGKKARKQIDLSRDMCSKLLGVKNEQLVFTSGGTESNSIVLSSLFLKSPGSHLIISAIEHPSVYEYSIALKKAGFDIDFIKLDKQGIIDPEKVKYMLKANTIFVSIMSVNNETGAIQPIKKISRIIRNFELNNKRKIHFHTDSVQALGKISVNSDLSDVDSASFSAHKISGPKGIGLLYLRKPIQVLSAGGGQEYAIRPGTENLSGIIAFSKALDISLTGFAKHIKNAESLKSLLINELLKITGVKLLFPYKQGEKDKYSPYIISISVNPIPGEVLVRILSDEGINISTGSACSSHNRKKQIRVLKASGISEIDSAGSIRISTGWSTTEKEIQFFCSTLKTKLIELRKYHK